MTGGSAGVPNSQGGTGGGSGGTAGGGSPSALGGGGQGGNGGGAAGSAGAGGGPTNRPARVLLYSFSTLNIPSVPAQLDVLEQKLEGWQFEVDRSVDPAVFSEQNLAKYAAVGMINTCFFPFGANRSGEAEAQALQKFLQDGGGLFGTHCADVTFQSADPVHLYNRLIGGRANSENFEGESDCYKMGEHPTIAALPATFVYDGNLDNTDFIGTDASVLVRCKWRGGAQKEVAVSWVRNEGSGRVFFSNFAKLDVDFTDPTIGENHLLAGLGWVLGR
jgi:type 1 glutamine amidotransferase